jgi:ABC-type branched-subunit amino acid transport system ATPase component
VTDRAAILDRGSIVFQDTSEALRRNPQILEAYLGVTERQPRGLARPIRH